MALEADNRLLGALTASKLGFNIGMVDDMGNPKLKKRGVKIDMYGDTDVFLSLTAAGKQTKVDFG